MLLTDGVPFGLVSDLPRDLTYADLAALPAYQRDDFVIEDLTDEEYEAFLDALEL